MKILVMGSAKHEGVNKSLFHTACNQIGKQLADRGHTIIINATEQWTADFHVLEGASSVTTKKPTVIFLESSGESENWFYKALGIAPDGESSRNLGRFTNIDFKFEAIGGRWPGNRIQAINRADVVLLIGGRFGVALVGASAPLLSTPVVAVKCFGGAASQIWEEANFSYGLANVSQDDANALRTEWNDNSASAVIRAAETMVKRNPFRRDRVPHSLIATSLFVLLASWVAIYILGVRTPNDISVFSLLGISALLGTGLRSELRLLADEASVLWGRRIGVEATAGILLAFIFCLLYLAGNFVLTGDFISLTGKPPKDFTRVAITVSLLGIATAFLLEPAAENVRIRLEKLIRGEK